MPKFYDRNLTTVSRKSVQYNAMNSLPARIAIRSQFTTLLGWLWGIFTFHGKQRLFANEINGTIVNRYDKQETFWFRFTIIYTQTQRPSLLKANTGSINSTLILFLTGLMDRLGLFLFEKVFRWKSLVLPFAILGHISSCRNVYSDR